MPNRDTGHNVPKWGHDQKFLIDSQDQESNLIQGEIKFILIRFR